MRIALLCADRGIPAGGTKGASIHMRGFAQALARRGHELDAFLARCDGTFPARMHRVDSDRLVVDLQTLQPDVVHERYALGAIDGLNAARALGVPYVVEVNAPLVAEATRHRPGSVRPGDAEAEARLLREADLVVTVSEPLRHWAASVRGTGHGVAVVPNGVEASHFPFPAPITGPPTVAFLGHPKPWHGADRLPRIMRALHGAGCAARLLVIGGGDGATRVGAASAALGLGDSVELTGPLPSDRAAAKLADAWVGVAPFPPRAFFYFSPLKVLDYLAAGLPVVTTAQGDLPAMVRDAGVAVPAGDEAALVTALANLLHNREACRSLGRRGRRRVMRHSTWDTAARRWEELVMPLVRKRASQ